MALDRGRWTRLALAAGAIAGGYVAERALVGRARSRPDPAAGDDVTPPADVRHRWVTTDDGARLHVVERGAGRPLVLLHGITLSTLTWHYQLTDLADRFRVVAVDQRGHGQSTQGDDKTSIERLATDLAAVLEALDLEDAVLVGHSMGGMVTMQLLCQKPEVVDARVAGVVLVATAAGGVAPAFGGVLARVTTPVTRRTATWRARRYGSWMPANDLSWALTRLSLGKGAAPSHVELTRAMVAATPYEVVSDLTLSLMGFDVRDRLGAVSVPALIIVGSHDTLTPVRQAKAIARCLPHADLLVLPGCGHMVMLERRAELAEAIGDFADKSQ